MCKENKMKVLDGCGQNSDLNGVEMKWYYLKNVDKSVFVVGVVIILQA